jgi:ankyrin repeat protein
MAARNGFFDCVRVLLDKGAEVDARDEARTTKREHTHTQQYRIASQKNARLISPVFARARTHVGTHLMNVQSQLLEQQEGRTALHHSVLGGHVSCSRLLVEGGADEGLVDKARAGDWDPIQKKAVVAHPR